MDDVDGVLNKVGRKAELMGVSSDAQVTGGSICDISVAKHAWGCGKIRRSPFIVAKPLLSWQQINAGWLSQGSRDTRFQPAPTTYMREVVRSDAVRRGFFTLMSGLSLLLCLMMAGLWVCIRWMPEHNVQRHFAGSMRADGTRSQYVLAFESERFAATQLRQIYPKSPTLGKMQPAIDLRGLQFVFSTGENATLLHSAAAKPQPPSFIYYHITVVAIPYWALIVASLISPVLWFRSRGKQMRALRLAKSCIHCGYDLRATPERCPECGHAVTALAV